MSHDPGDASVLDAPGSGAVALRGGSLRTLGYAAGMLLSLVSAPVLIHHLGVEGFGRYTTVTALIALVGTGSEAGVATLALREYAALTGDARAAAMRHLLGIRLVLTVAGVALAVLFALAAGYDDELVAGVAVAGAGLVTTMTAALLLVPLQATLRLGRVTLLTLLRQFLTAVGIIALALAGAALGPFFAVPLAAGAITIAVTVAVVRGGAPLRPTISPRAWGALLGQTLVYAVASAIYAAYFRLAMIVLSLRADEAQAGLFATSYRVIEVVLIVPGILVSTAFPLLTRARERDSDRFERGTVRLIELALLAGAATALGLLLATPLIVDVLTPADGEPAAAVLRIQAPAAIATFVAVAGGYPLLALHRQRAILLANAIALVAVLGLVLALTGGSDAARGAALATTVAELVLAAVTLALLARAVPGLRAVARSAPPLALALAAGLAPLAIPGLPAGGDTALGLAAFAAVLALTRALPPELSALWTRRH